MPYKLNISEKGKSWKLESDSEIFIAMKVGDKIKGSEISPNLEGYELEVTGASDKAGFPHKKDLEGAEIRRILLTKGWGMHKKPKWSGKKKVSTPNGLRLKKSVRGKQLSEKTVQINLNVLKQGSKKLTEVFPEQNKPKETKTEAPTQ